MELATCDVCPRRCALAEGAWGFCEVRSAHRGSVQDMYHSAIAWPGLLVRWGMDLPFAFTPSRNKPIAEVYLPGCNLACDFCVGPYLSRIANIRGIRWVESADLVRAVAGSVDGLVFSGGDPAIHPEYLTEVFSECRERRMFTGLETNGYMTRSTAEKLAKCTNHVSFGLKASLDPDFYKQRLGIVDTQPIREAAKVFAESGCDMLLTNLTDPKLWEDKQAFEATTEWIVQNLGPDTRLVLAPMETTDRIPVTPQEQRETHLEAYRKLAIKAGLRQVFFQVDVRRRYEERQEHLRKIGWFRALEGLGNRPTH